MWPKAPKTYVSALSPVGTYSGSRQIFLATGGCAVAALFGESPSGGTDIEIPHDDHETVELYSTSRGYHALLPGRGSPIAQG